MNVTHDEDTSRKLHCYEYPRPAVTVDLAVFALFGTQLRVLLVLRKHEPFAGRWALPGGFLEIDEPIEDAARRELREETGFEVAAPVELIGVFGQPGRDPRGRTISLVHAAVVRDAHARVAGGDDAAEAAWHDPKLCRDLAFDHDLVLATALDWLGRRVSQGSFALGILPIPFGDDEVKALYRALGKDVRAAVNWRKRMLHDGRIASTRPGGEPSQAVAE